MSVSAAQILDPAHPELPPGSVGVPNARADGDRIAVASPPGRRKPWPAIIVTVPAMLLVALWGLDRGSLWGDEGVTAYAAHLQVGQLLHMLGNVDAVHGLYYLLMHVVVQFGSTEVALRLPSVLGAVVAVGLTTAIGVRLSNSVRVGALGGLIMAATPFVSTYAQDARSYALVFAAVMGAGLVLVHAVQQRPSAGNSRAHQPGQVRSTMPAAPARYWVSYAGLLTLAGYLNELALLVLLAHATTLLIARTTRPIWIRWAAASAAACILVAPLAWLSTTQSHAVQRIQRPTPARLFGLWQLCLGTSALCCVLVGACALIGALPAARAGRRRPNTITLSSFALPLLIVAPALLFVESVTAKPLFVERYLLFCEAGAALLAGAGGDRIIRWALQRVRPARAGGPASTNGPAPGRRGPRLLQGWMPVVALSLSLLLLQLPAQRLTRSARGWPQDFAGAANYISPRSRTGDGLVFVPHSFRWARLGYPRQYQRLDDTALDRTPEQAGNLNGYNKTRSQMRRDLLDHRRVWLVGRPTNQVLFPSDAFQLQVLTQNFTLVLDKRFHGVEVRRYDRRPSG